MEPQKTIGLLNLWLAVERKHLDDNAYLPVRGNGLMDEALACYAGGLGSFPCGDLLIAKLVSRWLGSELNHYR